MGSLNWWKIPQRAWIIILSELTVIVGLAGSLYSQYLNNQYFQSYVNTNVIPVAVPVLSVLFGIISASVATFLYFGMRRVQQSERVDDMPRRKLHRKMKRGRGVNVESRTSKSESNMNAGVPKPRFVITNSSTTKEMSSSGKDTSSTEKKDK